MLRLTLRTLTRIAAIAAAVAAWSASAAAQTITVAPTIDRSTTEMRVHGYVDPGGPSVRLCEHSGTGTHTQTCGIPLSGSATVASTGEGGVIRTQIAAAGTHSEWGELDASVSSTLTGRIVVDLTGYGALSSATAEATFHLGGRLHAYAIGPTAFALASAGYTVRVDGSAGAPAQSVSPFAYGCYWWLGGCVDRWTASARGGG